eukprot:INCI15038.1.p1 GENE.INCI15038.1~~INCI15038.1.p1  ORF type:complete len:627 (+),score=113.48 INCI15038.1:222-2102(+)
MASFNGEEDPNPVTEAEATEAFASHDTAGSGHIDKQGMINTLAELGVDIDEDHAVLQGVQPDAKINLAEFIVFLRICQGTGHGPRGVAKKKKKKKNSTTTTTNNNNNKNKKNVDHSFRRSSGIRTAMLKLGVVTNNFFTKKAKTSSSKGDSGSGAAAATAEHAPGARQSSRVSHSHDAAEWRRNLSPHHGVGHQGSGSGSSIDAATNTIASTAVPSSDVFVEEEPLPAAVAQPNLRTPNKLHSDSQYARNNPHSSVGRSFAAQNDYAMSPVVTSQSSPFARASLSASRPTNLRQRHELDYSRRRSSGRIGARFLAMHGAHGAGSEAVAGRPDSAETRVAAPQAGGTSSSATSAGNTPSGSAGTEVDDLHGQSAGGVTTRVSNGHVLSMKEIAERLRQFNGPLGGLPAGEAKTDDGGESAEESSQNLSSGIGWRIFGWAGKSNLGRRMHPRPRSLGDETSAASQWTAAVAAATSAAAMEKQRLQQEKQQMQSQGSPKTPERLKHPSDSHEGSAAKSDSSPSFGELVTSPRRRALGTGPAQGSSTPRSRRQELFASAQKRYKEAAPGPVSGDGQAIAVDAYTTSGAGMRSPVRTVGAPANLTIEQRSLPRTPSMIPRVRSPQRRQTVQ